MEGNIPRGKTLSITSHCSLHVQGEMAYFLSRHNIVGRYNLPEPRVSLMFLFCMPRMRGPDPLYLRFHLSRPYLQGVACRDEMLSPSGTESTFAIKDVSSALASVAQSVRRCPMHQKVWGSSWGTQLMLFL